MPRRAKPKAPPPHRHRDCPRAQFGVADLETFLRAHRGRPAWPEAIIVAELQAIADAYRETATAPRPPAPSVTLAWVEEAQRTATKLAALFGDPAAVAQLVGALTASELAALTRWRAALAEARCRALAHVMTAGGGAPSSGVATARQALRELAVRAFVQPLPRGFIAAFDAWFMARCPWRNRGKLRPDSVRARRARITA
jgi:hypothetical protein